MEKIKYLIDSEEVLESVFQESLVNSMLEDNIREEFLEEIDNEYGNASFDLDMMHRNSGTTRIIVQWGILSLLYYVLVVRSFKHVIRIYNPVRPWHVFLPFIVLFLSGFSQSIFQYPFFLGLMFLEFIPGNLENESEDNLVLEHT